ncbi:MAG: hypothetical protein JWM59_2309 [Verrucomicrobiales bacterium]|nr:hypothetical protein [Verrucomicrobiales bacterium]
MKMALRLIALIILLTTFGWWLAAGKNPGWTKNQVAIQKFDPILEISYIEGYEKRFIPGVDFLAVGSAAGIIIFGLSFLPVFRRKRPV